VHQLGVHASIRKEAVMAEERQDNGLYHCPDCDREFDTPQGLGSHRARTHGYRRIPATNMEALQQAGLPFPDAQEDEEPAELTFEVLAELTELRSYSSALDQFLPMLADEIRTRGSSETVSDLTEAFFLLYLDQANL
jgi:uncharacterized C2H2 Zn-finger protein